MVYANYKYEWNYAKEQSLINFIMENNVRMLLTNLQSHGQCADINTIVRTVSLQTPATLDILEMRRRPGHNIATTETYNYWKMKMESMIRV
jgi:hypothetical protein